MAEQRSGWGEAQEVARRAGAGVDAALNWFADPRAKLLRRRRTARVATAGLTGTAGMSGAGTLGLAAVGASEWLVVPGVGVTALFAAPAVAMALRVRRLHRIPLPPARRRWTSLPAPGSPARAPMRRLDRAESSVAELLRVLGHDPSVPPGEIAEADAAAELAAARLRAEAADLTALARARDSSPVAAQELAGVLHAAERRLEEGVEGYERLVAAAARAVAARSTGPTTDGDLLAATDRVDALTAALQELAALHAGRQ